MHSARQKSFSAQLEEDQHTEKPSTLPPNLEDERQTEMNSPTMQSEYDQSTRHVQEEGKIESRSNDAFSDHDEPTSSSQLTTPDSLTSDTKSLGSDEGESGEHNHMVHVTAKQPGPAKHQSAASAYWHLVSGGLVFDCGGWLFIPAAASEKPWNLKDDLPRLSMFPDGPFSQEDLEKQRAFLERE